VIDELDFQMACQVYLGLAHAARPARASRQAVLVRDGLRFPYFRFYGPLETYFDGSWKLDDVTPT